MEHIWLLTLSVFGFLISYYIWYKHNFKKEKLVCMIGDDCAKVISSKYGRLLGAENTILGMFYYIFIFVAGILHFTFPNLFTLNYVIYSLLIITGGTALVSVYLTFVQLSVLKELCEYCLVANIVNVLIFLVILL